MSPGSWYCWSRGVQGLSALSGECSCTEFRHLRVLLTVAEAGSIREPPHGCSSPSRLAQTSVRRGEVLGTELRTGGIGAEVDLLSSMTASLTW
ncbi:hypothetical protein BX283_7809 [Streptomyces sp. TLI_146]|nr:hypothetical protein BX283_7809 [Streptomyces sp. TLI_146]